MNLKNIDSKKYYTYLLIDSTTCIPFYVGKGCGNRLYTHEKTVKLGKIPNKTNYDLFNKINNILINNGHVIHEKIKENMDGLEALALETAFIDFYGLDNLCNYFKSWNGSAFRSEKTRKRQSEALRGSKSYMFGKPKTQYQKLKNSIAHRGSNNARYDKQIYKFTNNALNLVECCTKFELRNKYNLDSSAIYYMLVGKRYSVKGWSLGLTSHEIEKIRRNKISKKLKNKQKTIEHRMNLWKNRRKGQNLHI